MSATHPMSSRATPTLWTTLSFRAAKRWGVQHLAGQPVALFRIGPQYRMFCRGEMIGMCISPKQMRERGGLLRAAETRYPTRSRVV